MLRKIQAIALAAARRGYVAHRGRWVKEWPSGKQWSFEFDGTSPTIEDQHGRIVRDTRHGISYLGLLVNA